MEEHVGDTVGFWPRTGSRGIHYAKWPVVTSEGEEGVIPLQLLTTSLAAFLFFFSLSCSPPPVVSSVCLFVCLSLSLSLFLSLHARRPRDTVTYHACVITVAVSVLGTRGVVFGSRVQKCY